ncbi:MAG: hypothetical protein RLZZ609_2704 [Cyanobacteriota bacterium]
MLLRRAEPFARSSRTGITGRLGLDFLLGSVSFPSAALPLVLRFARCALPFVLFPPVSVLVSAAVDLPEVLDAAGSGNYGDLNESEILLEFANFSQPPYLLAGLGLAIGIVCGLTFSRGVQERLDDWKQDRLPLLPLARVQTVLPWIGLLLGVTFFLGGSLQIFGFAPGAAVLLAFLLSLATGGALWVQLVRLMEQVQAGNFKAVDFDNFDEFF